MRLEYVEWMCNILKVRLSWFFEKLRNAFYRLRYPYVSNKLRKIKIRTIEETIQTIVKKHASISRFGDGEMMWMLEVGHGSFQDVSSELSTALEKVINSNTDILIGLPDAFKTVKHFKYRSGRIWRTELSKYGLSFAKILSPTKQYYNANISRMYIDYNDYDRSGKIFLMLKEIWRDRDILIVEGSSSRLGVGNDFFVGSKSIKRIICPSRNAFSKYDTILSTSEQVAKTIDDPLILIALGPTATVLACDLHEEGFQSIDIGHVDVEYEWYLMHAKRKVSLMYKDVSEVSDNNPQINIADEKYKSEIIRRIF